MMVPELAVKRLSLLKEAVPARTWLAMAVAFAGIVVMFADSLDAGRLAQVLEHLVENADSAVRAAATEQLLALQRRSAITGWRQ